MKALVIGRGSMGKRRIRDLTALGVDVESWDITDDGPLSYDHFRGRSVVVSTPPQTKQKYADLASYNLSYCFTESDVDFISAYPDGVNSRCPSATPLFTDWYDLIVNVGHRVIGYALHVGQHIDDWHPGASPLEYYAYNDETSPTREMIPFELIWLTKALGSVKEAKGFRKHDVAQASVFHSGGAIGNIFIDARARPAVRRFDFVCRDGEQRVWNLDYTEQVYAREMRAFVDSVEGRTPWPYTQAEEAANLEVLHTIERSG